MMQIPFAKFFFKIQNTSISSLKDKIVDKSLKVYHWIGTYVLYSRNICLIKF